jgi:hypothetical protein
VAFLEIIQGLVQWRFWELTEERVQWRFRYIPTKINGCQG